MFIKNLKEFNLPKLEEKVLDFWKKNQIFERSLKTAADQRGSKRGLKRNGRKTFVFYEGPPTANGRPGIHHVLARAFKDVVLRYKTMRGYYAPRRAGWDTHGLPVEIQVEKELGLKSKKDIEKYGIAEFNRKCRESVWQHKDEWEKLTERMGFWLDMKNPYITYEKNYIETLWWIISQIAKRKLLYKGNRIVNWCPRCGTGLSSHEMALGYKEVVDESIYIKFRIKNKELRIKGKTIKLDKPTFILSWTTTPWTLSGNVALAVGEKITYVFIEVGDGVFVVAKERMKEVGIGGTVIKEVKGKDLVGLSYKPLFDVKLLQNRVSHKIYAADFVTTTDGTGVVHTAVMYGEDDYKLGLKVGLPHHHTVDEAGKFIKDVKGLGGLYVKAPETEKKIFKHLEKNGNFLKVEKYEHEYPHCWRCETPLLYYARQSWFVAISKLKKELLKNNETINWLPEHIKNGRFGEWLRDVKDWNFSRERYWGTPLPIWECKECGAHETMGSLEDLDRATGGARNKYWMMRHGESETQLIGKIDAGQGRYHLTDRGKEQAKKTAAGLKSEKINLVVASPLIRTRETAKIAARVLGIKKVIFDKRLEEIYLPSFAGKSPAAYWRDFPTVKDRFEKQPPGGESLRDVRARLWDLLHDLEKKYRGRNILLISHDYPLWMLWQTACGASEEEAVLEKTGRGADFIKVGRSEPLVLKVLPRDETGEANLHRPYVDGITWKCRKCKGEMKRVKELADAWFDSGAMPFAQGHWPFDQNNELRIKNYGLGKLEYPADYIAEAVDQTRGWFYTLLAVATALGKSTPYKNVICLGHINDKFGQKMSKSKGNVVDPWQMAEKYGIDAVRWYFYTASPPGEPRNFDEQEILKTYRRFHLILWNSLVFYLTYADKKLDVGHKRLDTKTSHISHLTSNVLDQWIIARLGETVKKATKYFDNYQIRDAALALEGFVADLSRWYIRRSRRRFQKPASLADHRAASVTLGYVLRELGKIIAPFNPFFGEFIYFALGGKKSIHLEEWPVISDKRQTTRDKLIKDMEEVRRLAALGLAKRAETGIKVRQPLATLRVAANHKSQITNNKQLLEILAEEVNVKKVVFDKTISGEVELDTNITAELKEEGIIRELVRAVQDLRQKAGLSSNDRIVVMLELPENLREIVLRSEDLLKKEIGAKKVEYKKSGKFEAEVQTKLEEAEVWLGLRKV